jgi:4-hydroxyproline epimerase
MQRIRYVDSHTGGEPTRLALDGFPDLTALPLRERVAALRTQHDRYRCALVTEPRASDVVVGAFLMPPVEKGSVASVIYFNNAGYLGMCGHGTIGVIATLQFLGKIPGGHASTRYARRHGHLHAGRARTRVDRECRFLPSPQSDRSRGRRIRQGDGRRRLGRQLVLPRRRARSRYPPRSCRAVDGVHRRRAALARETRRHGPRRQRDRPHRALRETSRSDYDCRNFVLCPGNAYDRSPCGTGTSARLACLAADGDLAEGATWRQESIVGSVFEGSYRKVDGGIVPIITGQAFVCGEGTAILDPADPFCWGIR